MNENRDSIYEERKQRSLTAQSFLAALNENLDKETAFKIAVDAFTIYMTKTRS